MYKNTTRSKVNVYGKYTGADVLEKDPRLKPAVSCISSITGSHETDVQKTCLRDSAVDDHDLEILDNAQFVHWWNDGHAQDI